MQVDEFNDVTILSTNEGLAPRIRMEIETLRRAGLGVSVIFRRRIGWGIRTFINLPLYYLHVLKSSFLWPGRAMQITHLGQLPLSPFLKLMGKLVIYDAYERYSVDISEQHFKGWMRKPAKFLIELFENLTVSLFVDAMFVVSTPDEYLSHRYRRYCRFVECLFNVPTRNSTFPGDLSDKFINGKLRIVYAGAINRQKGADNFIHLARLLKTKKVDFELHLIGPFENETLRKRLMSEIASSGLTCIAVHDPMDYASMVEFLYSCHLGLSLYMDKARLRLIGIGSSRKNYTYMTAGVVVITSDIGLLGYVITKERCGIVISDPNDLEQVAEAIQILDRDRSLGIAYAERGIAAIKEKYNWEHEEEKLLNIYRALLGSRRAPR